MDCYQVTDGWRCERCAVLQRVEGSKLKVRFSQMMFCVKSPKSASMVQLRTSWTQTQTQKLLKQIKRAKDVVYLTNWYCTFAGDEWCWLQWIIQIQIFMCILSVSTVPPGGMARRFIAVRGRGLRAQHAQNPLRSKQGWLWTQCICTLYEQTGVTVHFTNKLVSACSQTVLVFFACITSQTTL